MFKQEQNPEELIKLSSLWDEILLSKGLYNNRYLRLLCKVLFLKRLGLGVFEAAGPIFLVRNGLPRETLGRIAVGSFLITIWIPLLIGKFITGKKLENKVAMIAIAY